MCAVHDTGSIAENATLVAVCDSAPDRFMIMAIEQAPFLSMGKSRRANMAKFDSCISPAMFGTQACMDISMVSYDL